jgi:DNA-binding winged helix-turn-helix (wHTH) protein/Tfp pilus assembly protein PilF
MDYECIWDFGNFSFCASDYRLSTRGSVKRLPPKQAALLLLFLENPSRVLPRREIIGHLWPSIHVGGTSLGVQINGLRRALGDTAMDPRFIETVDFLGFRFLGEVQCTKRPVRNSAGADLKNFSGATFSAREKAAVRAQCSTTHFNNRFDVSDASSKGEAQRLYALGRQWWRLRTNPDVQRATECYEKAIKLAPSFPLPYVGMADAYNYLSMHPGGNYSSYQSSRNAKECAHQAIRLNPNFAPAWAALGHAQFTSDWEVNAAEDSYKIAISLDPAYAPAHQWYSWLLLALGRQAESVREIRCAHQLDGHEPNSKVAYGFHLHCLGQTDQAIKEFRAVLDANPEFMPAYREIGRVYEAQGNYSKAVEVYRQAQTKAKLYPEMAAVYAYALTKTGREEQATQILSSLLKDQAKIALPLYEVAIILVGLARLDDAARMLEVAWEQRCVWAISLLFDSRLECLRTKKVIQRLVGRFAGLGQYTLYRSDRYGAVLGIPATVVE